MASVQSLSGLLTKLQDSVKASTAVLPESDALIPPKDGISLLDTKADLFLSYLQNLVFLILVKLRKHRRTLSNDAGGAEEISQLEGLDEEAVKKLVELRVYLEKGVRPLEGKLKYQIDKVLLAADTSSRAPHTSTQKSHNKQKRDKKSAGSETSSNEEDDEDESDEADSAAEEVDELSYRPNLSSLARSAAAAQPRPSRRAEEREEVSDGIYRPPRIAPTSLPTTDLDGQRRDRSAKPLRSAAVDDYIAAELDTAPTAEPSIGSTITAGGRGTKTARDRAKDDERRAYEETNFLRLPAVSKKEKAAEGARQRARGGAMGEFDLSSLSAMGDRVAQATAKRGGGKRGRDLADGQRGDGLGPGFKEKKKRKF